jgi:hypothetical protein
MRMTIPLCLFLAAGSGCGRPANDDPRNQTNPAFIPPDQAKSVFEPNSAEDAIEKWAKSLHGGVERDQHRPGWPVVELRLENTKLDDDALAAGLKQFESPANLRRLDLHFTLISDRGMKSLAPLIGLDSLNLSHSKITDDGFEPLRTLVSLRQIDLSHASAFRGSGLRHLPGLETVDLSESNPDDAGMAGVADLKHLKVLDLRQTIVGDAGVKHFAGLTALETLDLSVTGVTDAGLEHLVNLPKLRILDLSGTAVTDAGMKKLTACPALERVIVRETNVTADGAQVLKPKCEVIR